MWIVSQKRDKVCYCNYITLDDKTFTIRDDRGEELGTYASLEDCQKVLNDIIDSIKYKHDIFNMPRIEKEKKKK